MTKRERSQLMCSGHWHLVPAARQRAVMRLFRRGQDVDPARVSDAYMTEARLARQEVAVREIEEARQGMTGTRGRR